MKPLRSLWLIALLLIFALPAFAAQQPVTSLDDAMAKAKKEKTQLFITYGRAACGNCQALKSYIKTGRVRLSADKFVYVDLNCDDPAIQREFSKRYKVSGNTLPFVVIADADGKQIDSRTGYGQEKEFEKFIKNAGKKNEK